MSNAYFATYASGRSTPFAQIEVRDLDGRVLGACFADSAGQWSVALPEIVQWIEIFSMARSSRRDALIDRPVSCAGVGLHANEPELSISCWSFEERFAEGGLGGRGIGGRTTAEPGQKITANIGGRRFDTVVCDDGTWVIAFDAQTIEALANGIHLLCVTVRDKEGNEAIVWDEVEVG
ncbi:MAG: hypothetical protein JSS14_05330 [Proteobacteria bacterium]|nr:hypothetical protein [Pseudomonadota bacterium]